MMSEAVTWQETAWLEYAWYFLDEGETERSEDER